MAGAHLVETDLLRQGDLAWGGDTMMTIAMMWLACLAILLEITARAITHD